MRERGWRPISKGDVRVISRKGDDNFAKLLTWARERWSFCPIIFGGHAEQSRAERLAAQVQGISAAGKLSLRAFIAAASWCAAFVGGDSGPVHIAAALGIPTLALYGPTDPQRTGPLEEQMVIFRSPVGVMHNPAVTISKQNVYPFHPYS